MIMNGKKIFDDKKLEGKYANYFKVGHNAFEFIIDFGQYLPEAEQTMLNVRIVTAPTYAKVLFKILKDSINQYEKIYGNIAEEL